MKKGFPSHGVKRLGEGHAFAVKPSTDRFLTVGDKLDYSSDLFSLSSVVTVQRGTLPASSYNLWSLSYIEATGEICAIEHSNGSGFPVDGVAYSNDSGATWSSSSLPTAGFWSHIINDGSDFYVFDVIDGKILKSATGASWTLISTVTPGIELNPNSQLFYQNSTFYLALVSDQFIPTVASSPDAVTWTVASDPQLEGPSSEGVSFFAVNSNGLMLAIINAIEPTLGVLAYKSTSVAGTWEPVLNFPAISVNGIESLPGDERIFINGTSCIATTDLVNFDIINSLYMGNNTRLLAAVGPYDYVYNVGVIKRGTNSLITGLDPTLFGNLNGSLQSTGFSTYFVALSASELGSVRNDKFYVTTIDESLKVAKPITAHAEILGLIITPIVGYAKQLGSDPLLEPGCLLNYNPDPAKFKACDGISTYPTSSTALKQKFPKTTITLRPVFSTATVSTSYRISYANSTLIYCLNNDPFTNYKLAIYTSTNGGATWTLQQESTANPVSFVTANATYDGSVYFLGARDDASGQLVDIYTMSSLSATPVLSGFNGTTYPSYGHMATVSLSTSSTFIIVDDSGIGKVWQTTDQGSTWSNVHSFSGSVTDFKEYNHAGIGVRYYVATSQGVYRSADMTSWTLVSLTTAYYSSIVYNAVQDKWVFGSEYMYGVALTGTWLIGSATSTALTAIGEYFVDGNGALSYDGLSFRPVIAEFTSIEHVPFSGRFVNYGSGTLLYGEGGAPGRAPYELTIDNSVMQMPAGGYNQTGLGLYMRIDV
jgi:hypothetical protein